MRKVKKRLWDLNDEDVVLVPGCKGKYVVTIDNIPGQLIMHPFGDWHEEGKRRVRLEELLAANCKKKNPKRMVYDSDEKIQCLLVGRMNGFAPLK